MSAISYSQARLFSECPAKFKAERIDGLAAAPSLPMKQGAFVHLAIEGYTKRLCGIEKIKDPDLALAIAEDAWRKGGHDLPEIVKEDTLRLVRAVAENVPIFRACVVGIEASIAIDARGRAVAWDDPSAVVRGRLDRLEIADGAMTVWDLKSGRVIEDPAQSVQLALYVALARSISPDMDSFIGKLYFPRHNVERVAPIPAGRADAALAWALGIGEKINKAKDTGDFPATPGAGCSNCPLFWSCEERKKLAIPEAVRVPETEDAAARMVLRTEVLGRELSELRELLKLFIERNGAVQVNDILADIGIVNRYKWAPAKLAQVLSQNHLDPWKYVKGDSAKLKREAGKNPGFAAALSAITENRSGTKLNIRRFGTEAASAFGEENDQ